jgi:2-polyprenyl-3-methyl-5-hydroxy-6-metoxy-1,4-benzoquinol methylase
LDVGCGEGHLFHALSSEAKKYYVGVETDQTAREMAQKRTGSLIIEKLEALKDMDKCFEVIVLNQVIEHFRDPIESLRTLEQISSDTASLFIATANSTSLQARIRRCNWEQLQNRTHLHLFTEASLTLALHKGGWTNTVRINKPLRYPHHGMLRRLFHRRLRKLTLDGNLTLLSHKF